MAESLGSTHSKSSSEIREGDRDAEAELLLRVFADSRRSVARIVGTPDRAEDTLQEAMIVLLLRLRSGGLTDPESARQFVYGVARRLEANARRKEQRRRTSTSLAGTAPADPAPTALAALLLRERRGMIVDALAAMHPARDGLILYRLYMLDHDRERIRDDFGLTASGFDRVLCRARARFRRFLSRRP